MLHSPPLTDTGPVPRALATLAFSVPPLRNVPPL